MTVTGSAIRGYHPAEMTDATCVHAALHGDTRAFAMLVDRHAPACLRYATRMLGSREDAEDVTQETLLRAHAALARYDATMRPSHVAAPIAAVETLGGPTVPVRFSLVAPNATMVSIVGDFNRWNPRALPMRRSPDGRIWEIEVRLPLGRYDYAFMIDGRLSPDPAAPRDVNDDFGAPNSIVMVRGS